METKQDSNKSNEIKIKGIMIISESNPEKRSSAKIICKQIENPVLENNPAKKTMNININLAKTRSHSKEQSKHSHSSKRRSNEVVF